MVVKKKTADSKSGKTDALSIRIDPRLRYGLELLARQQRRSVTGVVEWAIDSAFNEQTVQWQNDHQLPFRDGLALLWQENEIERMILLATCAPQLLTYEESRVWKVVKETDAFWLERKHRTLESFKTDDVLADWSKIAPLIYEAAEMPVVRGLTETALKAAGVDVDSLLLPF